jgi:hypothetical protein
MRIVQEKRSSRNLSISIFCEGAIRLKRQRFGQKREREALSHQKDSLAGRSREDRMPEVPTEDEEGNEGPEGQDGEDVEKGVEANEGAK